MGVGKGGVDVNSSRYKLRDFERAQLLVNLRKKARLTQQMAAQQIGVSTKTLRNWEGGSNYPIDVHLRRLIEVYLDHRAFSSGQERDEASILWQQFQASTHRLLNDFDERWFAQLLTQQQAYTSSLNGLVSASSPGAPADVVTGLHAESQSSFDSAVFTKYRSSARPQPADWNEAIDVSHWYGRNDELIQLQHWLLEDRCRLVSLLGIGGIGKTTLAIKLIQQVAPHFECVLWHSLANAPTLNELLRDWLPQLSEQQVTLLPHQFDQALTLLMDLLRKRRCLLVLDNLETILQEGQLEAEYRQGYEAYATLIRSIAHTPHQSCLLLTSRELFLGPGIFPENHTPVRVFRVPALNLPACQLLLQGKGLFGGPEAWNELIQRYTGNPLALKIVAETISEIFDGDVAAFLKQGITIFHSLRSLLAQQFERLSALEQILIYWLAIEREPVAWETLRANVWPVVSPSDAIDAIHSLRNRSLIERGIRKGLFTLQPVVLEYVTERLVALISDEIKESKPSLLLTHALLQGQAPDYIRVSQSRLLIKPIHDKLLSHFKNAQELEVHLDGLLRQISTLPLARQGYGGGNVVNMLVQLTGHLKGKDCSSLTIWQANLQEVEVQETTFAGSDLTGSVFLEALDGITFVACSPDGQYLAAGAQHGQIYIWRMVDGQPLRVLSAHAGRVQSLVFTLDGTRLVSGGYDGIVKVWNLENGTCARLLQGHTRWVGLMSMHPGGRLLATCSEDREIRIWNLETGECLKIWREQSPVLSVAWSPNGQFLASSYINGMIKLWDQMNQQYLWSVHAHRGWPAACLAFSPDGELLVSGGEDATIGMWQVRSGQHLGTLVGHSDRILSVAFNAQGMLASGSFDRTIKLWQFDTVGRSSAAPLCIGTLHGHTGLVFAIAFSPEGVLASGSLDGTIKLWQWSDEEEKGKCLRTLRGYSRLVTTVAFSPDGQLLLSEESNGRVRLWDTMTGRCLRTFSKLVGEASAFIFHPNGRLVAHSWPDSTIKLYKVKSGQCIRTLRGHQGEVCTMIFSADGRFLASGSIDGTVRLWEIESGECLATLQKHHSWVWALAWSPTGQLLASGSCDGEIKLWDRDRGTCLRSIQGTRAVLALHFAPDGKQILSSNARELLVIWNTESGDCIRTVVESEEIYWPGSVAVSADGNWLATAGADQMVKLWDGHKGDLQRSFTCQGSKPWSVTLSADQRLVAAGTEEGTIFLWEWHTGKCLRTLRCDRPYEHMNIAGATGLTEAQRVSLTALGAIDEWS